LDKISTGYGIILCMILSGTAVFLSSFVHLGAVTIAIILGIILGNTAKPGKLFEKGISFCEKHILAFAIALMGINLNFLILKKLGYRSVLLIVTGVAVTIVSALIFARLFHFDRRFALLLGIGNGICGSSAIAATKDLVGAKKEEVGLSIAIVNFLGTIGIFLLPLLASVLLKNGDINPGILIGNTLQAVGQVVAAGFTVSDLTGQTATIVKMTRILMLYPVFFILIMAFASEKKINNDGEKVKKPAVPIFIIGFILFSFIPTFSLLPETYIKMISRLGHYSLILAMAGIGLRITIQSILQDGKKALLIGGLVFSIQLIFSSSMLLIFF